jgi:hypothetical protein
VHEILFVKRRKGRNTLLEQARSVFAALGLESYEERHSSNYPPDDHYFVGLATNGAVEVCDSDDPDLPQYQYWVVVTDRALSAASQALPSTDPRRLACKLARDGFEVFLPSAGWPLVGWDGTGEYFTPGSQDSDAASDA